MQADSPWVRCSWRRHGCRHLFDFVRFDRAREQGQIAATVQAVMERMTALTLALILLLQAQLPPSV